MGVPFYDSVCNRPTTGQQRAETSCDRMGSIRDKALAAEWLDQHVLKADSLAALLAKVRAEASRVNVVAVALGPLDDHGGEIRVNGHFVWAFDTLGEAASLQRAIVTALAALPKEEETDG